MTDEQVVAKYEELWRSGAVAAGKTHAVFSEAARRGQETECAVGLMRATYTPEQLEALAEREATREVPLHPNHQATETVAAPASRSSSASDAEFGDDDL